MPVPGQTLQSDAMPPHSPLRSLLTLSALFGAAAIVVFGASRLETHPRLLQFVFTSDAHYGLRRPTFRGSTDVDAAVVNAALIATVNSLPAQRFPDDGGVGAGEAVGALDLLVEGGDIANRQETTTERQIQPASDSWSQFVHDYVDGLHTQDALGQPTRLVVVPGNHDASNAVGFHKPMRPQRDDAALLSIYNLMIRPPQPLTPASFDYGRDRFFMSRDLGGLHLQFLHIWPDSAMRTRMDRDLAQVDRDTPVMVFTHDQPDVEAKHFINPNGGHDVNDHDRFENLLADTFADGPTIEADSTIEQQQFEAFVAGHANITAYFHGNSNWQQAYDWNGPGRTARLHVFRVDSPMKGAVSAQDETRLSFQVVTIDPARRVMTVRECLWNARRGQGLLWGETTTVTLGSVHPT